MADIPVNLMETGGRLVLPGTAPPRSKPGAGSVPADSTVTASPPGATKTDKKPAEVKDDEPKTCRHCGWPHATDPTEPDPGDAQAFRDAVFNGLSYEKTVQIYGTTSVTFRDLSADEESEAQRVVIEESAKTPNMTRAELFERLTEVRLGYAVVKATVGSRVYTPSDKLTASESHLAMRTWCKSDTVYRSVRWQYTRFHAILHVLMTRAADRSFFVATGPAGV